MREKAGSGFRVAHSSRVLVQASRLRELSCRVGNEFVNDLWNEMGGRFVVAGRHDRHSGRVSYPEFRRQRRTRPVAAVRTATPDAPVLQLCALL